MSEILIKKAVYQSDMKAAGIFRQPLSIRIALNSRLSFFEAGAQAR